MCLRNSNEQSFKCPNKEIIMLKLQSAIIYLQVILVTSSCLVPGHHEQVRADQLSTPIGPPRMQKHQFYRSFVARSRTFSKIYKIDYTHKLRPRQIKCNCCSAFYIKVLLFSSGFCANMTSLTRYIFNQCCYIRV